MKHDLRSKLADALRIISPHDEALVRFEAALRLRAAMLGTDEHRVDPVMALQMQVALESTFGILPKCVDAHLVPEKVSSVFISCLLQALETIPLNLAHGFEGHLAFKSISLDDTPTVASALRGSFLHYAERAHITDPI